MSMDGMTMEDKCERLEPCGMCDVNTSRRCNYRLRAVCSMLQFVQVYVRRVIHVVVHNGLTDVGSVLAVVHTFPVAICHSYLFVNFWFRMYCIYIAAAHIRAKKKTWQKPNRPVHPENWMSRVLETAKGPFHTAHSSYQRIVDREPCPKPACNERKEKQSASRNLRAKHTKQTNTNNRKQLACCPCAIHRKWEYMCESRVLPTFLQ